MMPEDRLKEARKQICVLLNSGDVPDEVFRELVQMRSEIDELIETVEQWREFVDDAEVVSE
jgi:uncharacterized protein YdcH (DUF465 family)